MKQVIGIIAGLLVAGAAVAQDTGFYAGGSIGRSDFRDGCEGVPGSCDDEDTAWKIFGGYQVNRTLGVELGYTDLGEVSAPDADASAEAKAFELVGVGTLPLSERFSLYGKAGAYRAEVEGRADGDRFDDDNTDFTLGAGVKFDMTQNVALRGEWQRYMDVGSSDAESDVDVLSVGVLVRF